MSVQRCSECGEIYPSHDDHICVRTTAATCEWTDENGIHHVTAAVGGSTPSLGVPAPDAFSRWEDGDRIRALCTPGVLASDESATTQCSHCGESKPWVGLCDRMGDLCGKAAAREHASGVPATEQPRKESPGS